MSTLREQVLEALKKVNDPDLHRDIVSLNMVKSVEIEQSIAKIGVELTTPACPLRETIEQDIRSAVLGVKGISEVSVEFTANVSQRKAVNEDLLPGVKNVIAVASGKGGVGKSTVSVNLALSLARTGARVGLLDADIYGPNIPMMVGVNQPPRITQDKKMIPHEAYGIKVISMGFLLGDDEPVVWRGPMLNSALRQLLGDAIWGELDYLLVDLPPGTGDVHISLCQMVPITGAVIVTTPQAVALQDVRKGMMMFHLLKTPILGLIENMSYFICPHGERVEIFAHGGGQRAAEQMGVPFLGEIALDTRIRIGGDEGKPVVAADPDGVIARMFLHAAKTLAAQASIANLKQD